MTTATDTQANAEASADLAGVVRNTLQQMADWLDDDAKVHPCNFASAYKGFEITMALCRSVTEGGQVALPLTTTADEIDMLRESVPNRKVLLSMSANAKEYGA